MVVVLGEGDVVVAASKRARESLEGLREGEPLPARLLQGENGHGPLSVPYEAAGRRERLVYLGAPVTWRRTRSCGPGSPQRSRTSCARRSPGCWRCSRPRSCPARIRFRSSRGRATRSSASGSSSTTCSFSASSRRGARSSRSAAHVCSRCSRRWPVTWPSRPPAPVSGSPPRGIRQSRWASGRACWRQSRRTSPRTRSATPAPARRARSPSAARGKPLSSARSTTEWVCRRQELGRLFERFFRADRSRASRGTGLGPRDREARRHRCRRNGGSQRRARPRPRDPLHVPR